MSNGQRGTGANSRGIVTPTIVLPGDPRWGSPLQPKTIERLTSSEVASLSHILESEGARNVAAEARISATAQKPRSQITSIRADMGEARAYKKALQRGEAGLMRPLGANWKGPDFITAARRNGKVWIFVNDAKTSMKGRFPRKKWSVPRKWYPFVDRALAKGNLQLNNRLLEEEIRLAYKQGRMMRRHIHVDYSPSGQGKVSGFGKEKPLLKKLPTPSVKAINKRGVGGDSRATTNRTQASKKPLPSKAPIASEQGGATKKEPASTKVPVPTKKVGKFRLFVKGLKGFGIGLLIDYAISKLIKSIKGDPVKRAFEHHLRKLDGAISKAIVAESRSIEYYQKQYPGQTIYAELNLQYVLRHDGTGGDPDFLGMQLLFVQMSIKPHNSSLTRSGLPKSLEKNWTGKQWKDLQRARYFKTETVTAAISVPHPIEGDFYGSWMAGYNSKLAARTRLWAVFTIMLKSGYLEMSGYLFDKNRKFKDLKITIDQVTKDHIYFHVTADGEKATKEIHIGTTNTPGFLNGVWKLKVHPDHPNPDRIPKSGQERWFRPKHAGLQRALSKKYMHLDGVEPQYNKEWEKWKKRN